MWRCEDVRMRRCEDVMWRCEDVRMWRWADVKMRRCKDEQMWRWEDVKMWGCEDVRMWGWEDVKMWWCEDEKMWRCEDVKMRKCEDVRVWRWEDVKMWGCEDEMWRWADVKMRRYEDVRMWRCEDVKMWGCEDEKMWRCENVWQTPTIRRTLRSDALGKNSSVFREGDVRHREFCCGEARSSAAVSLPWQLFFYRGQTARSRIESRPAKPREICTAVFLDSSSPVKPSDSAGWCFSVWQPRPCLDSCFSRKI